MSDDYVVVYALYVEGQDFHEATTDIDDFAEIVKGYVRKFEVPCTGHATITVLSMPKAKWDSYGEAPLG